MRIAALALTVTLLTACTPPSSGAGAPSPTPDRYHPEAPAQRGGTGFLTDFEYPQTLNPLTAATDIELRLGGLVFAPLWGLDDALRPYPDLTNELPTVANGGVRTSADRRSMTVNVKLRSGLRWSDGQPLTADDVIFTLQALKDSETAAAVTEDFGRIREVRRRSDTELVWSFDGTYAPYLQLGAALFVMPAHRLAAVPHREWGRDDFFQRPNVGSGPFVVSEARPGERLFFDANPHYENRGAAGPRGHQPYLSRLVFKAEAGKAAELAALGAQAADLGFHLSPDDLRAVRGMPGASPLVFTGLRDEFLNPNHRPNTASGRAAPWLEDGRVLDALDRVLDRSAIATGALAGAGGPARGLFPRALRGVASGSRLPAGRDLEAARRLLDAAGWRAGADGIRVRDGRRLEFGLLASCGSEISGRVLPLLTSQWLEAGAAVAAVCLPRKSFLQAGASGAFDMTLASNGWGADPSSWAVYGTSGGAQNWNHCQDRALDDAFARGISTLDPKLQLRAYQQVEREWLAYHCTIPLFETPEVRAVSPRLHNFAPSPGLGADTWNAADWWLTPGA